MMIETDRDALMRNPPTEVMKKMAKKYANRTSEAEVQAAGEFLDSMAKAIAKALAVDNDPLTIERQHAYDIMRECEMHADSLRLKEVL